MADFNVSLQQPQGAGAGVLSPVQQQVTRFENPFVATALGMTEIFVKNQRENEKKKAEEQKNTVLQEYAQRYNTIAEDRTGQLSNPQKSALTGSLFSQYVAQHPELVDEFKKITSGSREMGNMVGVIDEEKAIKDERRKRVSDMANSGLVVSVTDSPEYQDGMWRVRQETVRQQQLAEEIRKRESHAASMASEARSAETYDLKRQAEVSLTNQGSEYLNAMRLKADALIKEAGGDPEKIKQAQADWSKVMGLYDQTITSVGIHNPELANSWRTPAKTIDQYFQDAIVGKTVTEAQNNQVKMIEYGTKTKLMSTPEGAAFFTSVQMAPNAFDQILKNVGTQTLSNVFKAVTGKGNAASFTSSPEDAKAAVDILKALSDTYDKAPDPTSKEQARKQGVNIVNKVLKDMSASDVYGADTKSFAALMKSIDFKFFAEQVAAGNVDMNALSNATAVAARVYRSPVIAEVSQRLSTPFVRTGGLTPSSSPTTPVSELVNINFTNGKVLFEPKQKGYLSPVDLAGHRQMIRELQSSSEAISQIVRIDAHVKGSTDYTKTWEDNKHRYFPQVFPDPNLLKVGQKITAKNGDVYEYIGGDYNDIAGSYKLVGSKDGSK